MRAEAKKITTAAVCTALAVIMCAMSAYLPLSIMPLYFAAFCIFLACKRGSLIYGLLAAIATVGIMFAFVGLSVKWFFLLIMFAPYGIITYFIHRFTYFRVKTGVLRGIFAALYFNLTFAAVYLIATRALTSGLDVPIAEWVEKLGGYYVLAIIGTALLVPLDFIFSSMSLVILKRIPMPNSAPRKSKADFYAQKQAEGQEENPNVDIFGYELNEEPKGEDPTQDDKNTKE